MQEISVRTGQVVPRPVPTITRLPRSARRAQVILGGATDTGGAALIAAVTPGTGEAADLLKAAGRAIQGGGGGKGDIAVAGGKNPEGVDEALQIAGDAARAAG